MKLGEKGFTLIELLMVIAIVALIANAAAMSTFQVLRNTEGNRNKMTAVNQVQNAGYWISLDAQRAQTVETNEPEETFTVSWEHRETGDLESDDYLYFAFSSDNGSTWGSNNVAFQGNIGSTPQSFSHAIPSEYLSDGFKMRFYLEGFGGYGGEYAYIDNIAIIRDSEEIFTDYCSSFTNWDNGDVWDIYSGEFRGHHDYGEDDRYLAMSNALDLTPVAAEFPLTFEWATWDEFGGTEHQVTYSLADGKLIRSHYIDENPLIETYIAQYIDPANTSCSFANGKLTFTVTATVGSGPAGVSESRQFRVLTRPD